MNPITCTPTVAAVEPLKMRLDDPALRVLVACEFSGVVRNAFRAKGHEAYSCDLLESEDGGPHMVCDARMAISQKWDLLIGHPPCTYLCNSGVRWLAPGGKLDPARHKLMMEACNFFAALYWADAPRVAIENPVMHKYARDYLQSVWKVPTHSQTIQPWQHGHGEVKRTCLWLRGLPLLKPSQIVSGRTPRVHHASPGPTRWKERSRTLEGVARAFAAQWSPLFSAPPASTTG